MARAEKPVLRGWRRGLRIARRIVLGLVALVVVAIAVVLILLHTDWGRDILRAQIESAAKLNLPGGLKIGKLEGSVLGRVTLRDVVIKDRNGKDAVRIARLDLGIGLTDLVGKEIHIEDLVADGVKVDVYEFEKDGATVLNVVDMIYLDPEPLTWDIAIDGITVKNGTIVYPQRDLTVEKFALAGSASIEAAGPIAAKATIAGNWKERGDAPIAIATDVAIGADGVITSKQTKASVADVVVEASALRVKPDSLALFEVSGVVDVKAPKDAMQRFLPEVVHPSVGAKIAFAPAGVGVHRVTVDGTTIGGTTLSGAVLVTSDPEMPKVNGELKASQFDATAVFAAAPQTAIDTTIAVDMSIHPDESDLRMVTGTLEAKETRGTIRGIEVTSFIGKVAVDDGVATANAELVAPGIEYVKLENAEVRLRDDGAIAIANAKITANVPDVPKAIPKQLASSPIDRGGAIVDVTVGGTIRAGKPDLDVDGTVIATGVRVDGKGADRAVARLKVNHVGDPDRLPTGRVDVTVTGATDGTFDLPMLVASATHDGDRTFDVHVDTAPAPGARWSVDLDAEVKPRGSLTSGRATIELARYDVVTRGIAWRGSGGTVDVSPTRIAFAGLTPSVAGGKLAIDGDVALRGGTLGDIDATADIAEVDLREIDKALDLDGDLRGVASAQVDVLRRGGGYEGTVTGAVRGLATSDGADPIDVTIDAKLEPHASSTTITGGVVARGARLGEVKIAMDVTAPRRLDDIVAWSRLERRAIRKLDMKGTGIDLAAAAGIAGQPPPAEGKVDIDVSMTPTETRGTIRGHAIVVPRVPAPIDATITLADGPNGSVAATAVIDVHAIAHANVTGSVELPSRPFDPRAWMGIDAAALGAIHAEIDEIDLDATLARRLDIGPWRGRVKATIDIAAGLETAKVTATARDVRGGPLARPIDVALTGIADQRGMRVDATATMRARLPDRARAPGEAPEPPMAPVVATITASTPLRAVAAWDGTFAAFLAAPITATVTLPKSELTPIWQTIDLGRRLRGTIEATATAGGTIGAPTGDATITIRDFGSQRSQVRELVIGGHYADNKVTATIRGTQAEGGRMDITAAVDLAKPLDATATVKIRRFELQPFARLLPDVLLGLTGKLDAFLDVQGIDPETARVTGTVRIRNGGLAVTDLLGALRQSTVDIVLDPGAASIKVEGKIESGTVKLQAIAGLDGLLPRTATVDLQVRDVAVISATQPEIDGDVHATVRRIGDRWQVDANVRNGNVAIPEKEGKALHSTATPVDMVFVDGDTPTDDLVPGTKRTSSFLLWLGKRPSNPFLDIDLDIAPIAIRSATARTEVGGRLDIRIGDDGLGVDGNLETSSGEIALPPSGRRYQIDRAAVRFDGSIDPLLDIRLVHEFPQLTLRANVRGRASAPELVLTSDPANYTEGQLLSFFLGGAPGGEPGSEARDAAVGAASAVLSQTVGGFVGKYLPIRPDVLRFEAATAKSSAAFVAGEWLTSKLFVVVRSRIGSRPDENASEAEAEYWLSRRLVLDGVFGFNGGIHGLDLLWTRRW
jgi:hypothetical protein